VLRRAGLAQIYLFDTNHPQECRASRDCTVMRPYPARFPLPALAVFVSADVRG